MTAYTLGSRGPRVDSGVSGIRTTLAAAGSHQAPAAGQREPGGKQHAVGQQGGSRVPHPHPGARRTPAPPPCRPSTPRPRGLTAPPARPPRASMATAAPPSRAATMSRSSCGAPHRHGGRVPCSSNVPARDAAQHHRVCGRGWPQATETPRGSRDCGSLSDRGQCAGAL